MNLRYLIIVLVILLIASFCTSKKSDSLKDAFKDKYLIGTALTDYQIKGNDPKSLQTAGEQFDVITPENVLKWEKVHPAPGIYNFGPVDSLIEFCEKNNLAVIGHTLIWHHQTPEWVFKDKEGNQVSKDTLLKRIKEHIFTVVGKYKGRIHGWDVINEAFEDDGSFRNTLWRQIAGEDYLHKAFEWAHEADPGAELYYNDYNMWYKGRRNAVVKMVNEFKTKNIPIHGIGLQGHWGLNYPTVDELNEVFEIYSKLDINVMVTELDLDMLPRPEDYEGADISVNYEAKSVLNPWPDSLPDSMQTVVADRYAQFFTIFNKYSSSVSRITLWGVHDGQSWRNYWPIHGRTAYPLLFDRNHQPKKAFFEVIKTAQQK